MVRRLKENKELKAVNHFHINQLFCGIQHCPNLEMQFLHQLMFESCQETTVLLKLIHIFKGNSSDWHQYHICEIFQVLSIHNVMKFQLQLKHFSPNEL